MKKIINFDFGRIIISILFFGIAYLFKDNDVWFLSLLIVSYIIISYEVIFTALKNIFKGEFFDENFLMSLATICAFFIGEYPEAVMVMLLYEIGEYLSDLAVNKSKASITSLMDLRSDYINLKIDGKVIKKRTMDAKAGDIFVVSPGEKFALDGVVVSGDGYVDTSSINGESRPLKIKRGSEVISGWVNKDGLIEVRAKCELKESTANKILELIQNSNERKTNTEKFITKFAKIYTPIVVVLAILLVVIPWLLGLDLDTWIYRALVFLVTSCPCALVISVPLGFFCGIGRASKEGILIKGSAEIERLTHVKAIVFDKTGTITKGNFEVIKTCTCDISKEDILRFAALAESFSNHPIALSIKRAYGEDLSNEKISDFKEYEGYGVCAKIDGDEVLVGNEKLLQKFKIKYEKDGDVGTLVYVVLNDKCLGHIVIGDDIKEEAYDLTKNLAKIGINNVIMLSGDNIDIVSDVSGKVKIKTYYANLLPNDKVDRLNKIKEENFTAFVGDGINDAPVIKLSDIGIAMGCIGSDAAIEASDVVLMNDDLNKLPLSIKIARMTKRVVKENIIFALGFKFLMLFLAVFGFTSIFLAVFADVGVTLILILNSLLIMKRRI